MLFTIYPNCYENIVFNDYLVDYGYCPDMDSWFAEYMVSDKSCQD